MIAFPEAADSEATRFVDAAFSFDVETSLMEIVGAGSLSVIVTEPVAVPRVALEGLDKVIVKPSSISSRESSLIVAETVFEVWPGVKVSVVELIALKSEVQ